MDKETIGQECATCRFGFQVELDVFICRRHAPRPSLEEEGFAYWPQIVAGDWCGEFRSKEEGK